MGLYRVVFGDVVEDVEADSHYEAYTSVRDLLFKHNVMPRVKEVFITDWAEGKTVGYAWIYPSEKKEFGDPDKKHIDLLNRCFTKKDDDRPCFYIAL